jgi:hypothetical protein
MVPAVENISAGEITFLVLDRIDFNIMNDTMLTGYAGMLVAKSEDTSRSGGTPHRQEPRGKPGGVSDGRRTGRTIL